MHLDVKKTHLPQIVCERIKQYIIENELRAGDKLPSEKQLIDMLKVSRTVIREALKTLETLCILCIKPGDGIYVDSPSLKPFMEQVSFQWQTNELKVKELLATRRVLEIGAIEMAIEHHPVRLFDEMDQINLRMEQVIASRQSPIEEDLAFHRLLFKATGNQSYYELSDVVSQFFHQMREIHFIDVKKTLVSLEEHKQIVKWMRARNAEKAVLVMKKHLKPLEQLVSGRR